MNQEGQATTTTAINGNPGASNSANSTPLPSTTINESVTIKSVPIPSTATTETPTASTLSPTFLSGSPTPSCSTLDRDGVSTGVAAGVAVGSAIGAALIAVLATWLFVRSRNGRKSHRRPHRRHNTEKSLGSFNAEGLVDSRMENSHSWQSHLPQPTDDSSLRLSMKTLFHQIELHVENFYSDRHEVAHFPAEVQAGIDKFKSDDLPTPVSTLMQQSGQKTAVIKHCLMRHIISHISISGIAQSSFLPVECTALALASRRVGSVSDKPATREAYSQWRVLTAYLRPDKSSGHQEDPDYIAKRESAVQSAATAFSNAFAPWAVPSQSDLTRTQNLAAIMRSAADVGITIFAQPADFEYIWKELEDKRSRGASGRRIVVAPGFAKITDDRASPLERKFIIVSPVVCDI